MIDLNCKSCGKIFSVYPSRLKKGLVKYCSMACYKPKEERVIACCKFCNTEFGVHPAEHRRGGGIFCSKICSGKELSKTRVNFIRENPLERFYRFFDTNSKKESCWIWSGGKDYDGYGIFCIDKKSWKAHRYSYELFVGPIPKGKLICHTCDNPSCINPSHLFLGSPQDNMNDKMKKGRHKAPFGSEHKKSKLQEEKVKIIKQRLAKGDRITHIANDYDISVSVIFEIKNALSWKHVMID